MATREQGLLAAEEVEAAEAEQPVTQSTQRNITAWIQIGLTLVALILAAFVWTAGTAKTEAAAATSQVAEDITEIKDTMNAMSESLRDVREWKASAQEVMRQLQTQSALCLRHVERYERKWPKGPSI